MRRTAFLVLLAAGALAGCQSTPPNYTATTAPDYAVPMHRFYGPYDSQTNPYCGVMGNCEPSITEPYAIAPYWTSQ